MRWYSECTQWPLRFSVEDYFAAIDDFAESHLEPSAEPGSEPAEEPEPENGLRLYLTAAGLSQSQPALSVELIPSQCWQQCEPISSDPSLIRSFSIQGLSGSYDSGDLELSISLDTAAVGQTVQARVQVDLNGDGSIDLERLYDFWALDAAAGSWEQFDTPSVAMQSGGWTELSNATVVVDLWSSFGGRRPSLGQAILLLPLTQSNALYRNAVFSLAVINCAEISSYSEEKEVLWDCDHGAEQAWNRWLWHGVFGRS